MVIPGSLWQNSKILSPSMIPSDEPFTLAEDSPKFAPGQVIFHTRYHYRGVVVGFDLVCMASMEWYQNNQTQPKRQQPWYHILVDRQAHTTYVAQENLRLDESEVPIAHPLLNAFFDSFHEGAYIRNELTWQDFWESQS